VLIAADVRAYICREPVDMRKSIDGLSYLVEPLLAQNPVSGSLFVFVGRDRSKVKCLYWDRTGFALCTSALNGAAYLSVSARATRLHARRTQRLARRH
jgi:transposase